MPKPRNTPVIRSFVSQIGGGSVAAAARNRHVIGVVKPSCNKAVSHGHASDAAGNRPSQYFDISMGNVHVAAKPTNVRTIARPAPATLTETNIPMLATKATWMVPAATN